MAIKMAIKWCQNGDETAKKWRSKWRKKDDKIATKWG